MNSPQLTKMHNIAIKSIIAMLPVFKDFKYLEKSRKEVVKLEFYNPNFKKANNMSYVDTIIFHDL